MSTFAAVPEAQSWGRIPISNAEDLHDAVYGAGLDVVQMSRAPIRGSLVFAGGDGVTYSSGSIEGQVALAGPLSETGVTLGVGLRLPPGSRHWLNEVTTRNIGVYRAGDPHEALYAPGSLYVTATLSVEDLERIAAAMGLVLDERQLGGSGISSRLMDGAETRGLRAAFDAIHAGSPQAGSCNMKFGRRALEGMICHLAREPRPVLGAAVPHRHGAIVARARAFILEHLDEPLSIEGIAQAAYTSQRTLYRAFLDVFDETPQSFVRKLRLNRIRNDLASHAEAGCTITLIANRWGISELGRLSGWYRELFGELPSQTLARGN
jgi:AraC-like DNA-binding protein